MLLAININNTETKVGLFRGESLESHWRLTTTPQRTPDEWASTLTSYLAQAGRSTQEGRAAIVASVVPPVTQGLCAVREREEMHANRQVRERGPEPRRAAARGLEHVTPLQRPRADGPHVGPIAT